MALNNANRMFMFQLDVFDEKEKTLERKKIMTQRPVGGTFKVTNGDVLCDITIDKWGVLVRCQNSKGDFEYISTKKISADPVEAPKILGK